MCENSSTDAKTNKQGLGSDTDELREKLRSLEDGVILEITIGGEDTGRE